MLINLVKNLQRHRLQHNFLYSMLATQLNITMNVRYIKKKKTLFSLQTFAEKREEVQTGSAFLSQACHYLTPWHG